MSAKVPIHQWTHDGGRVLIVRYVNSDGTSHGDFQWPLTVGAEVVAPDWNPEPKCGGGLHGWPWGRFIGDGKDPEWAATWLVVSADPKDVVDLGGKVKCRACRVEYVGSWYAALAMVRAGAIAHVEAVSDGKHATGDQSASSATGDRSASSATGDQSASSATGDQSAAVVTGCGGNAKAGRFGAVALGWWNKLEQRGEMRCARVGVGDGSDGLLKADVWYSLDATGEFVES